MAVAGMWYFGICNYIWNALVHTFENSVVITWPDSLLFAVNVLKAVPYNTGRELRCHVEQL